jgi:hypothetical protein
MSREKAALIAAALLLLSLYAYVLYNHLWPQERVWEARVFDCRYNEKRDYTYVAGYDGGYLRLRGRYELEVNATYRIRYISRKPNWADKVLSIERIG